MLHDEAMLKIGDKVLLEVYDIWATPASRHEFYFVHMLFAVPLKCARLDNLHGVLNPRLLMLY